MKYGLPLTASGAALELDFYRSKRQGKIKDKKSIEREDFSQIRDFLKEELIGLEATAQGTRISYFAAHRDPVIASLLEFYHGSISLREYGEQVESNHQKAYTNFSLGLGMIVKEFDKFDKAKSKMKISDISTLVKFCLILSQNAAIVEEGVHKRYIA